MKKTLINILVILVIVGATFGATRQWFPKVEDRTVTDTVRVDVPYEVEKIVEKEVPVRITEYKTKYDTVESVRVEKDTVYVDTGLNTYGYNTRFLTEYPQSPRFLGLQFANDELELTYQTTDGNVRGKTWNAPQGYRVGLNNGQPNIETFRDQRQDFASYSAGVGMLYSYKGLSPYLTLEAEFRMLGVEPTTSVYVGEQSFITAGINYEF